MVQPFSHLQIKATMLSVLVITVAPFRMAAQHAVYNSRVARKTHNAVQAFADILWGFSGLMFPATHEIQNWTVLQVVQVIISAVLLMDLLSKRQNSYQSKLQESSVSA